MRLHDTLRRRLALTLALLIIIETVAPTVALALTSGPSHPEVQGFAPIEANNMVDLFSGDFSYNLPLFEIEGYPVNMSYNSNSRMEDEASWVGLGWTLNPGSVSREVRGVPDDFKEEQVVKDLDMRRDITVGLTYAKSSPELFGIPLKSKFSNGNISGSEIGVGLTKSIGLTWNNKKGFSLGLSASPEFDLKKTLTILDYDGGTIAKGVSAPLATGGVTVSVNSETGLDFKPHIGLARQQGKIAWSLSSNININSRQGLKALNFGLSIQTMFKKFANVGFAPNMSYDLGSYTYFPTNPLPVVNNSGFFKFSKGPATTGYFKGRSLSAFFSVQKLSTTSKTQSAFGYLYQAEADKTHDDKPRDTDSDILDCNREAQLVYREHMPNIPLSYGTPDNFAVAGQGIGGQFRLYKNQIGVLHNGSMKNTSVSVSAGLELGGGPGKHVGVDASVSTNSSITKPWKEANPMPQVLAMTKNDKTHEAVYFKDVSEKTVDENSDYNDKIGNDDPIFTPLSMSGRTVLPEAAWKSQHLQNINKERKHSLEGVNNLEKNKNSRARRGNVFSYLTVAETAKIGLDKAVKGCGKNEAMMPECNPIRSVGRDFTANPHHIGEISVTKTDGSRYVFGLPVYNRVQKEVSFSVNRPKIMPVGNNDNDLISYSPSTEAGYTDRPQYKDTKEGFYEAQNIPAHATSYLLTGVLSDDYVDVTGNGITNDDLGNAVKFNYTLASNKFKWRAPFGENTARWMQGSKADRYDDKASYVYGEKEVWYTHSIESRNMIAHFITENRNDAYGVKGVHGGIDFDQKLQKLKCIKIYSKSDIAERGAQAVPIKTVHFEYDYKLCKDVLNNEDVAKGRPNKDGLGEGKLTLKRVWFEFGNNKKGKSNAYKFCYKENATSAVDEFTYKPAEVDRWGFTKPRDSNLPAFIDFPYSTQDEISANQYAGAWNLTKIELPSGGSIEVNYESDDYAYLQDKRAGQMFLIEGFAKEPQKSYVGPSLFSGTGAGDVHKYVAINVSKYENILRGMSKDDIVERFFGDVKELYFKALVQLTGVTDPNNKEYVSGYMGYNKAGVVYDAVNKLLFIPITTFELKGNIVSNNTYTHPIALAALQSLRFNHSELAYGITGRTNDWDTMDALVLIKTLAVLFTDLRTLIRGFNRDRIKRNWCKEVMPLGSGTNRDAWVRLANPTYKKFGGGSRVKTITVNDNWKEGAAANYRQLFTYTKITKDGKTIISSGVACNEPQIGGEESALRNPMPYPDHHKIAPDNSFYTETPIGESFFPAANVGYSEVRVEVIEFNPDPEKKPIPLGTGYTVSKFYTAQDFPTLTDFTLISSGTVKSTAPLQGLAKFFKIASIDFRGVSQGFSVETNDMHGKPKEEIVYNKKGALISRTEYYYKVDAPNANDPNDKDKPLHLNNKVTVIDNTGTLVTEGVEMGREVEVWQEMQEDYNKMRNYGAQVNVDLAVGGPAPTGFPIINTEDQGVKTSITTKHIRRMGILDRVVKTVDGSTQTSKNLVYDKETGDVLLTETQNEFNDPLYSFTYPAHWAYDGMGMAYKNIGAIFKGITIDNNGEIINPDPNLVEGDEIMLTGSDTENQTYFIVKKSESLTAPLYVYESNKSNIHRGLPFNGRGRTYTVQIKRSGRRNMPSMPIGSFVSLKNPIKDGKLTIEETDLNDITKPGTQIIQAEVKEYKDSWQLQCEKKSTELTDSEGEKIELYNVKHIDLNPYTAGSKGNWRAFRSYVFYGDRNKATITENVSDIRKDGFIPHFYPFWSYGATGKKWYAGGGLEWVLGGEATRYDTRGNEIESKDANGIFSSASFGFKGTQAVAVTANSQHHEMTYDSFEDYYFDACGASSVPNDALSLSGKNIHFFKAKPGSDAISLTNRVSHTGNFSVSIKPQEKMKITVQMHNNCNDEIILPSPNQSTKPTDIPQTQDGIKLLRETAETSSNSVPKPTYDNCKNCLLDFRLWENKKYTVSVWVASDKSLKNNTKLRDFHITVVSENGATFTLLSPQGPVIDGWQKMEGTMKTSFLLSDAGKLERYLQFAFYNGAPSGSDTKLYIDDVRVLPFNAKMKAFAYDRRTRRLMAELDENHYATMYEYDDEGQLVRVKRETETGIQTVKEARSHLKPNN